MKTYRHLWLYTLAIVGILYFFIGLSIPFLGDDIGFHDKYIADNDVWYAYPRYIYRHWLWNNGRWADILTPVWLNFSPGWLRALFNGLFFSIFLFTAVRCCRLGNRGASPFWNTLVIFLILFTFPWDAIWMEWVTFFGYIWSAGILLAAYLCIFRHPSDNNGWWWLTVPLCFLAGAMHEAAGFPLGAAMAVYLLLHHRWRRMSLVKLMMSLALIAGGIFTLTSPAHFRRAMDTPGNDAAFAASYEPMWEIILTSGFYVIILIALCILAASFSRSKFKEYISGEALVFVVAAVISSGFLILSHMGGRPGWYAQLFALIALMQMLKTWNMAERPFAGMKILGWILSLSCVVQTGYVCYWQRLLARETWDVLGKYSISADGVVFADFHNEPALPAYLMRKTHGVPDADDTHYLTYQSRHFHKENLMIVLPGDMKDFDFSIPREQWLSDGSLLRPDSLPGEYDDWIVPQYPRRMVKINDKEYIRRTFTRCGQLWWLYTPTDRDPGEK